MAARETERARERQVSPTNAPIDEDERIVTREREKAMRRPFPWLMLAGVVVLVGLAVVAATAAGDQFVVPFVLIALTVGVFLAVHRMLGRVKTERYDTGRAQEQAADDAEDPVPHLGFDEQSQLGSTAELSDEEQQAHADMGPSTGQR